MNRRYRIALMHLVLLVAIFGCNQLSTSELNATTQPSSTPIPGWEKFEGPGAELWLPESFEGGDLSEDLDVIVENLRNLGPDFEPMAQMIEQNPSMYVIWVFDSEVGPSGFLTNVSVATERVPSAMTLDTYLDAALGILPDHFQVLERGIVMLGDHEAGRVVVEFALYGIVAKEVLYVIKDGTTIWAITYAAGDEDFPERLPVFEQSALTFKPH